jgi:hypothetical protein
MAWYQLYVLDDGGHIQSRTDDQFDGDFAAIERATTLKKDREIEVWQYTRYVARVRPQGDAA